MAGMTFFCQLSELTCIMRALFSVAGITVTRGLAVFLFIFMAITTFQSSMLAFQFKIREVMIKGEFVELDNIDVTTLMIRMTDPAFLLAYLAISAMIAGFIFYIPGNVLVACHAEFGLLAFIELVVTLATFIFILGMPLDHLAGAEQ